MLYYDRDGHPLSMVASDHVGPFWVSTVWIGLDHNFGPVGPPVIFETMTFAENSSEDVTTCRYATEAMRRLGWVIPQRADLLD